MGRFLRAAIEVLRLATARERLPEASSSGGTGVPARGRLLQKLFPQETLPLDPEPPRPVDKGRVLRALFGREQLDVLPEAPPRPRRGLARLLFAPEPLPQDPAPPPRQRSRWLRWLFAPEPIDPP